MRASVANRLRRARAIHKNNARFDHDHRPYLRPGVYHTLQTICNIERILGTPWTGVWCCGDCYNHNIRSYNVPKDSS